MVFNMYDERIPSTDRFGACLSEILDAVRRECDPAALVAAKVRELKSLSNSARGRICVLAVGKASVTMFDAAMQAAGTDVCRAVILHGERTAASRWAGDYRVSEYVCDHPLPSPRNITAARAVLKFIAGLNETDALLVLLSGGASAYLALPADGVSLQDLSEITAALQSHGASITELNTVRKHMEALKGGNLAAASKAGKIIVLVLSDVVGDKLDVIGSGPLHPDETTYADALAVLQAKGLLDAVPALTRRLRGGAAGNVPETPKPGHPCFTRVEHMVIGNNDLAVNAAAAAAQRHGFMIASMETGIESESPALGKRIGQLAIGPAVREDTAIIFGGEPTVSLGAAKGLGGPSQEVALTAAIVAAGHEAWALLAYSTDGRDGPTDAAGAIVNGHSIARMRVMGIDVERAVREHDSHAALAAAGCLLTTGPTGTNLNHVYVLLRAGA